MDKDKNYSVLGLNSGLGVSLYPFKKQLIGNIESRAIFHTPSNEQWKLNFRDIPLKKDSTFFLLEKPDVIISSPDCGSGSVFRLSRAKKLGDHKNNHSLIQFFEGIEHFKPKFFLFENLNGLFKSFPKEEFREMLQDYRLIIHNDTVAKWGNSQFSRKRLVIVGIRRDLPKGLKLFFFLPDLTEQTKTCGELYGDLTKEISGHVREDISDVISIHGGKRMSLFDIQQDWLHRLMGKKRWWVEGGNYKTAPGVYRNLDTDYPATARKANRQFDEVGLTLTPRQLARVQGVPDSFKLHIDLDRKQFWINKARTCVTKTPPMEISIWFKKCLEKAIKKYPIC